MSAKTSYYRPPRRIPSRDSKEEEGQGPKTRDFILLFIAFFIIALIIFGGSIAAHNLGLYQMAMGLGMLSSIFLFITFGTALLVGISYYITRGFLKREFDKKFKKLDEEREADYRRLRGIPDTDDESE